MKELRDSTNHNTKKVQEWCTAGSQLLSGMWKQVSPLWKQIICSYVLNTREPPQHQQRFTVGAVKCSVMDRSCNWSHPEPTLCRTYEANPAQGCCHLYVLHDWPQKLPRKGGPKPQPHQPWPSGSTAAAGCTFGANLPPRTAASCSHSCFLCFQEAQCKQLPSINTHPLGKRLHPNQPTATTQTQQKGC